MERILSDDKFLTTLLDETNSIFITRWKSVSSEIDSNVEEIKKYIKLIADEIASVHPKYYLANQTERNTVYTVDIQNWIAVTLLGGCKRGGVKKAAVVQSKNLIADISTDQMVSEASSELNFVVKYFSDENSAKKFLLS
ncbi:MAG: hypothetical protein MJ211_14355 [Bacteroidales bacterium]|nr:hypothetical protein [Bacteroidales bacterium]